MPVAELRWSTKTSVPHPDHVQSYWVLHQIQDWAELLERASSHVP
jgi:hypothetical protein